MSLKGNVSGSGDSEPSRAINRRFRLLIDLISLGTSYASGLKSSSKGASQSLRGLARGSGIPGSRIGTLLKFEDF